ncbi:DNA-3-methyladenine glycosylase I [Teredinibacter sp. KSP-S5-2]|uniref:DNA-3-methyladenine glycosylase I n=1 Tax=Teredinibacter sp. KSP-S5-2 TaxID=3034506 RepID=UPI0029343595|nr:DNA-3-methyladenine glycosylase I [Teredinibacter sp. KSP-S5-2]WNO09929.1 DNA-3-methyladenine glycosylase I [Teredinibacter sp. KSP-S5-2]
MRSFAEIYHTACLHKGSEEALTALLPKARTSRQLKNVTDDRYLSDMSRRIFRAGLKHEMVDKKWPGFEEVFDRFDPYSCAMLSDEDIERLMGDKRIIRHLGKVKAVRDNAAFVRAIQQEHGSFGCYLADWPVEDIAGLWITLKKRGKQLGGNSGAAFLRMVGKDTFLLTKDVVAVLKLEGVIEKEPSAQKDFYAAQRAFLQWREESGRPLCEISRIVSCSVS